MRLPSSARGRRQHGTAPPPTPEISNATTTQKTLGSVLIAVAVAVAVVIIMLSLMAQLPG